MKFGILKKFLAGFLVLSLVPMMVLGLYTWVRMNHVVELLVDSSRTALTQTSMSLLQARAGAIATQVEQFLDAAVADLNMLATLPPDSGIYNSFFPGPPADHMASHRGFTGTPGYNKHTAPLC